MEEKKYTPIMTSISQSFIYRPEISFDDVVNFIRTSLEGVERAEIVIKHVHVTDLLKENTAPQHIH